MEEVATVYLDEAGAYVYLFTTELAVDLGLIGLGEYFTRLACLLEMLEPGAELHKLVSERLRPSGEEFLRGWPDDQELASSHLIPEMEVRSEGDSVSTASDATKAEWLQLIYNQTGVLGDRWVFHRFDADFFPSVPHGHLKARSLIKLDAYRGYTWDTANANKPLAREHRRFIVGLWKNRKFRAFACDALNHFVAQNPSFNWGLRRILNPFRLPRRR